MTAGNYEQGEQKKHSPNPKKQVIKLQDPQGE